MGSFEYSAVNESARLIRGNLEAADDQAVIGWLRDQGCYPIRIDRKDGQATVAHSSPLGYFGGRPTRQDVLTFTHQLHTLLSAGLEVDRSLLILGDLVENSRMQRVIRQLLADVQGGASMADSLAKHPRIFSRFYVNMVKAGEAGGVLEVVLGRLSGFMESTKAIRDEVVSALMYPSLVIAVGGGAVFLLLNFVIPRFGTLFAESGQLLPLSTRILLSVSAFTASYWWIVLGVLLLGAIGLRGYMQTEEGKIARDHAMLRLPVFGRLIRELEVGRFARTFGTLLQSGVPVLVALRIVADTMGNAAIARTLPPVVERVKRGEGIAGPLRGSGAFPPLAIHMTSVGEETGRLEEMLLKVADAYDGRVKTSIKRLLSLLEPVLILGLGLLVGFIVVSMLLAILTISDLPI